MGLRLAVDQSGYTSQDVPVTEGILSGTDWVQMVFSAFLPQRALEHRFLFVINWLAVDFGENFGIDPIQMAWAYTGLWRTNGTPRINLGRVKHVPIALRVPVR